MAKLMGIEPMVSCVTGRCVDRYTTASGMTRRGFEPAALAVKVRCLNHLTNEPWLRRWDSNPRSLGYEPNEIATTLLRDRKPLGDRGERGRKLARRSYLASKASLLRRGWATHPSLSSSWEAILRRAGLGHLSQRYSCICYDRRGEPLMALSLGYDADPVSVVALTSVR